MKLYVAGHRGMVGSAIVKKLKVSQPEVDILTFTRSELDLTNQQAVHDMMQAERPDGVILAAAKVGGIAANNDYPAEFIYENLMIETNVIHNAYLSGVKKLVQLGSSCIYPKFAHQPMAEKELLTGVLEATNEPYAIAKIAGIKLCESYNRQYGVDYRSVMPTNLYGPRDNFHPTHSHVIPALIRRFHEAKIKGKKEVVIWGTGTPRREFLHVDDMAAATLFVFNLKREIINKETSPMLSHINIGFGSDIEIRELATLISNVVGYEGEIDFDISKPDGTPKKLLDVSRLRRLGWEPSVDLKTGLTETYKWFKDRDNSDLRL